MFNLLPAKTLLYISIDIERREFVCSENKIQLLVLQKGHSELFFFFLQHLLSTAVTFGCYPPSLHILVLPLTFCQN